MLEDMISVGPPARALEKYNQYEAAYYERKKTARSKIALSKNQNLQKEEENEKVSGRVMLQQQQPAVHNLGGNQGLISNS